MIQLLFSHFLYVCFSSIDVTYSTSLAKSVNDSPTKYENCKMIKIEVKGEPRLGLFAKRDIDKYDKLRYDYGIFGSEAIWRKVIILSIF